VEKHLLQSVISDMVIDQVENPQSLREILGNVEQQIIVNFAAIQLQMHQIRKSPQKTRQQTLLHLSEVVLKHPDSRVETTTVQQLL
jgi:hypothetical protein